MAPLPRAVVKAVPEAPHPPSGETPWVQRIEFRARYLWSVNRGARRAVEGPQRADLPVCQTTVCYFTDRTANGNVGDHVETCRGLRVIADASAGGRLFT